MAGDSPEAIKKACKLYTIIGGCLFVGTVLTVAVAKVPSLDVGGHGFDGYDAILGIAIATTKASLVAIIFMHLNHEKKAIYWIFLGALVMAGLLVAIFAGCYADPITFDALLPEGSTLNR